MISYFNYEINNNLNKLNKLKLINNKTITKPYINKANTYNYVEYVNKLPTYKMSLVVANETLQSVINNPQNELTDDNYQKELIKTQEELIKNKEAEMLDNIKFINDHLYLNKNVFNIVYQSKYVNKDYVTGFGDFIRSIYFALQFCDKYSFKYEFIINKHNIKKYLEYFCNNDAIDESIENNIYFFYTPNYKPLKNNNTIDYEYVDIDSEVFKCLNGLNVYNNNLYLYLINHPNKQLIKESTKQIVKNIIKPTNELSNYIDTFLSNLHLNKNNFIAIHIRYFDEKLGVINNAFVNQMKYIINLVNKIKQQHNLDILLLSSDNSIKTYLLNYIPYAKTHFNSICHVAYNNSNDEKTINTLKDFYAMSYSKYIYSFSVYEHGSGFSEWCATTYNIPYICYFIQ